MRILKGSFLFCVLFYLLFMPFLVMGEERKSVPINFFHLTSPTRGENSALSGSCTGNTESREIDCWFTQTRVMLKLSQEEYKERLKNFEKEMDDFKKDFNYKAKEFCEGMKKDASTDKKIADLEKTSPRTARKVSDLFLICSKPSYERIYNYLKQHIEDERVTCVISSYSHKETSHFKKVGPNKWISVEGPSGLCNQVVTITLENDPKYLEFWTYTQIRSHTD